MAAEAAGRWPARSATSGRRRSRPTADVAGDHDELTGSFVVANPHGLHARPAARLVQEVRRRDAHARIRNRRTESEWVDAGSLSKIATLGVRSGDEVEVRVSGSQAAETLDHILSLAARNFDESAVEAAATPEPTVRQAPIGAGPGLGIGPARSIADRAPPPSPTLPPTSPRSSGAGSARRSHRCGAPSASCGPAPPARSARPRRRSSTPTNCCSTTPRCSTTRGAASTRARPAVSAWSAAVQRLAAEFAAVPDPYLQARADDVRAVGDQVLRAAARHEREFRRAHRRAGGRRPDARRSRRTGPVPRGGGAAGVRQPTRAQRDPVAGEGDSGGRRRRPDRSIHS